MLPPAISTLLVCALSALAFGVPVTCAYDRNYELFEGSPCDLEDKNEKGECVLLPQCRSVLEQVKRQERRASDEGRCGFKGRIEIVCCPLGEIGRGGRSDTTKIGKPASSPPTPTATPTPTPATPTRKPLTIPDNIRPADAVCIQYETESIGENTGGIIPHITGGTPAKAGEFPYMVALGYANNGESSKLRYVCGGSLIDERHVLTAAHCVSNVDNIAPVEVKLGTITLNSTSASVQNVKVDKITTHPSYRRSYNYHDIAVIRLQSSVNITNNVMPICLQTKPITNLRTFANLNVLVTGWGATSFENEGSNDLQKTPSLSIIENGDCRQYYENFSKLPRGVDDSMICVLDQNMTRSSDACQGDSGGPLLLKLEGASTVIGITSFGQSCGSRIPAVYTSVYYYLDWIEGIVWPKKKNPEPNKPVLFL